VAGTGAPGFAGDGGQAILAQLYGPEALALDADGSLYIADTDNNRIRKVSPDGIITTVAGSGHAGDAGDGGPAVNATLNLPRGLAVESRGNLYIADTANNKVRMVDARGTISTLAGTGTPGFQGDGGSARSALLNGPMALAFSQSGILYIADAANNRIRQVTLGLETLRLVAPTDIGTASPFDPAALWDGYDINLAHNIFGGLYRYDARLNVVPDIAQGSPAVSTDGLTYTFRLKPHARFSNGVGVTAADFVYSWSRAVAQQAPFGTAFASVAGYDDVASGRVSVLSGLTATDDHTLVARLTAPDAFWVDELTVPAAWVVNRVVIERDGESAWWATPEGQIGTGPFRMTARLPNHSITFAPVPNWWGGSTGSLGAVHVDVVPNVADQIAGYRAGRYDILGYGLTDAPANQQIDRSWMKQWSVSGHKSEVHTQPYARTDWIGFNFASGPFAGRIEGRDGRLAFSLAIDRRQLVASACDNALLCTQASGGVISKGLEGYLGNGSDPTAVFNPAAARAALKRWDPDGSRVRGLQYAFDSTPFNRRVAESLRAQWKANLGVDVGLQELDRESFFINRPKGLYSLFRGSWFADYNHPQDWFGLLFRTGAEQNWGLYANQDLDSIVAAADRTVLGAGVARYRQAGRLLLNDVAYAALAYWNRSMVVKPYISGYGANALYDYSWTAIATTRA
jgi:ABC-type oligopeptide transport system substrate-binding subunit